ncbi:MAG TPA: hypothetical protein VJK09_02955 [Candidatus Paceibacterota bacterium]
MKKGLKFNIQFDIIREGKAFIAYSPALDLSTHAKSLKKVKKRFEEATELYFESLVANNNLEETLHNLGWGISRGSYVPPMIVSHEMSSFAIPSSV